MATSFLGIAACATCAPLNPAYTEAELRFYMNDLRIQAVLMRKGDFGPVRAVSAELGLSIFEIEEDIAEPAGHFRIASSPTAVVAQVEYSSAQNTALILHTSGTTARPKIVPLNQSNLLSSARSIAQHLGLNESDRCLNVMPLFHIHGIVGALLASIASGGSVVCTPGFHEQDFFDWIADHAPTWYTAVPTIHQSVVAQGARYRQRAPEHRFRFVRSSSSALSPRTYSELQSLVGAPVVEAYGMTEASHQMACNPLPPGVRKAGSVGVSAGAEIALMDEDGLLLPKDAIGEIVIRGAGVMQGYENNPDANGKAFSAGWFRTGDQGRFDEAGYLYITGRLKEIVNRGGEKISPREIDEALLEHQDVIQAVAFALPHPTLGEDLAVAVVLRPGAMVDEAGLRDFLFGCLADFKVPSTIVFTDAIPKGATGKVQRSTLHKLLASRVAKAFVKASSQTEHSLASIFEVVLEHIGVGVNDNFFALGGDSLRGTQVIVRINEMYGIDLAVPTLFRFPTVAALSIEVDAAVQSLFELASEIENMSDDEIARLLAEAEQSTKFSAD